MMKQYIMDTVVALEAIGKGRVLCIVCSRLQKENHKLYLLSDEEVVSIKKRLYGITKRNVHMADEVESIVNEIIHYFS